MVAVRPRLLRWIVGSSTHVSLSSDGRYALVRDTLPELDGGVRDVFLVRVVDADDDAQPGWSLGRPVAEVGSWQAAEEAAEEHARAALLGRVDDLPSDVSAIRVCRFSRPVSDGTDRGALVLAQRRGRVVAQVLSTVVEGDSCGVRVHAQLDVGPAPAQPKWRAAARLAWGRVRRAGGEAALSAAGEPPLSWDGGERWGRWCSTDGAYVILARMLPELRPDSAEVYMLRWIGPRARRGPASTSTLGDFVAEASTLAEAQRRAQAHARDLARPRDVPDSTAVLRRAPVQWWASDGGAVDALVLADEGDRLVARVMAMGPAAKHEGYAPVVQADLDVSRWSDRAAMMRGRTLAASHA